MTSTAPETPSLESCPRTSPEGGQYAPLSKAGLARIEACRADARAWNAWRAAAGAGTAGEPEHETNAASPTPRAVPAPGAATRNADYVDEYFAIMDGLDGDIAGRRAARSYMLGSTGIVHHLVVASSYVPRFYDRRTYDTMKYTVETTHRILCKVIQHYLDDPDYRTIFSYDERLAELILLPRGYDALLPFARFDVFLDENDLTLGFCEFNGDGSSGMNENREITNSLRDVPALREFAQRHQVQECELFEAWVEEFGRIYGTFVNRVEHPRFAVCDYLHNGVVDEFHLFAKLFEKHGTPCTVCDVRDLRFDGEVLRDAEGQRVDAIWRRAVTNDVLEYWNESQDLIEAVRAQKVALIGSFAGHIVHDKQIFEALYHPKTRAFLTQEEIDFVERTVPQTRFLDERDVDLADIRASKDAWIVKPTDAYGAADVFAGCACSQEEWDGIIDRFANGAAGAPFLVQRYITPFRTLILPPDLDIADQADDEVPREGALYNNLEGLYCYNGRFQGVFSRMGPYATISKPMAGITCATLWVDCDLEA